MISGRLRWGFCVFLPRVHLNFSRFLCFLFKREFEFFRYVIDRVQVPHVLVVAPCVWVQFFGQPAIRFTRFVGLRCHSATSSKFKTLPSTSTAVIRAVRSTPASSFSVI